MKRRISIARTLLALLPLVMTVSDARATSSRVFVAAKTGNDSNACNSVATPCQTFAGAIPQVVAGGEIIVLESGGYGPVTINSSVTINAPSGIVAFIHPPTGDAVTINAAAGDTVILRGLTLNGGAGNGISANSVGRLFVEHCTITGYGRTGVFFSAPGGSLFMRDDDVSSSGAGLYVGSGHAVVRSSSFNGNISNAVEAFTSTVMIEDCVASGNEVGFAVYALGTTAGDMTLDHVRGEFNHNGLNGLGGGFVAAYLYPEGGPFPDPPPALATLRFANSLATQNSNGLVVDAGGVVVGSSPGTSVVTGNGLDIYGSALGTPITLH